MTDDLRRLSLGSDLGATLLRSAKDDRVPEGAAARAVGAALLAGAAATPAGAGVATRVGTWLSAPAAKVTLVVASVLIAGGALVVASGVSPFAANLPTSSTLPHAPTLPSSAALVAPTAAPSPEISGTRADVPSLRIEDLPHAPPVAQTAMGPATTNKEPSSVPPVPSSATTEAERPKPEAPPLAADASLAEEVRALDGVRSAIRRGDRESALSQLAAYEAKFPKRQLGQEATVLRQRATALPSK